MVSYALFSSGIKRRVQEMPIEEGDGSLQELVDAGLCPFCKCKRKDPKESVCDYCDKIWIDQINKAGSLE